MRIQDVVSTSPYITDSSQSVQKVDCTRKFKKLDSSFDYDKVKGQQL